MCDQLGFHVRPQKDSERLRVVVGAASPDLSKLFQITVNIKWEGGK